MIITLVGASFKDSNIGTLSTWTISRVLGDGATYNGVTYVDKNAALNATVTIAEGYELGSAGVTVTMGGVAVTSGVTVSGNTITINISSVTGNVVVKVPTKNLSAGGGDVVEPDIPDTPSGSGERVYTIDETLKFNDMPEVAETFIEGSYYVSDNGSPAKLTVSVRDGYKAWKNIKVYAGQSYALNPDARAIVIYDANDIVISAFNLKNTYSDGVIPASVIAQDAYMSVTVTSATSNNSCTIKRVS